MLNSRFCGSQPTLLKARVTVTAVPPLRVPQLFFPEVFVAVVLRAQVKRGRVFAQVAVNASFGAAVGVAFGDFDQGAADDVGIAGHAGVEQRFATADGVDDVGVDVAGVVGADA